MAAQLLYTRIKSYVSKSVIADDCG